MINSQKRALLEEIERSVDYTYGWSDFSLKQKTSIEMEKLSAEIFTGKYISDSNKIMSIKNEDGLLFIMPEGQMPLELLRESDNKFFSIQLNIEVEFICDNLGNISSLSIDQNGQVLCFKKVN